MPGSNSHITILTVNVKGLNAPIKRHRLANWIKSQDPSVCCIQETQFTCKDKHRLKIKGWRKIYQANGEKKNAGVSILVSDKIDFKPTKIKRDKEEIGRASCRERVSTFKNPHDLIGSIWEIQDSLPIPKFLTFITSTKSPLPFTIT